MGPVPRQPEVAAHGRHCVGVAGLGGRAQVRPEPAGEGAVLPLAADPDVGGPQRGAGAGVLAAVDEVDAGGLAGDVLRDVGHRPGD